MNEENQDAGTSEAPALKPEAGGAIQPEPSDISTTPPPPEEEEVPQSGVELSFGEKLVGMNFNPSNDEKVTKAKQLCADLADLVIEHETEDATELRQQLYNHTIGEILNAQMNVVKLLTLKY